MKTKHLWLVPVLLLVCIITLSVYAYNQIVTKTTFSKTDIEKRVTSLFNSEVQSITEQTDDFKVTFLNDNFIYEVSVSKNEGTFSELKVLKEGSAPSPVEEETDSQAEEETPKEEPEEEVTKEPEEVKPLTKQEVIKIALSKFNGEVEDIEFVQTNDGGYYNVEIENDEEEATLQIHALTGVVLTITFDD